MPKAIDNCKFLAKFEMLQELRFWLLRSYADREFKEVKSYGQWDQLLSEILMSLFNAQSSAHENIYQLNFSQQFREFGKRVCVECGFGVRYAERIHRSTDRQNYRP